MAAFGELRSHALLEPEDSQIDLGEQEREGGRFRSPRREAAGSSVAMDVTNPIVEPLGYDDLVDKVAGKLPKQSLDQIRKAASTLATDLHKLVKARDRLTKIENDIKDFGKGKYPPGVKPFRVFDDPQFMNVFLADKINLTVQIKAGATIREAKEAVYMHMQAALKECDRQALECAVSALHINTTPESFGDRCKQSNENQFDAVASIIGHRLPDKYREQKTQIMSVAKADELYSEVAHKVASEVMIDQNKKKVAAQKEATRVQELGNMNQADLLRETIRAEYWHLNKGKSKGKGVSPGKGKGKGKATKGNNLDVDFSGLYTGTKTAEEAVTHSSTGYHAKPGAEPKQRRRTKSQLSKWKAEKGQFSKNEQGWWGKPKPTQQTKGGTKGKAASKGKGNAKGNAKGKPKGAGKKGKGKGWSGSKGLGKGKGKSGGK